MSVLRRTMAVFTVVMMALSMEAPPTGSPESVIIFNVCVVLKLCMIRKAAKSRATDQQFEIPRRPKRNLLLDQVFPDQRVGVRHREIPVSCIGIIQR